MFTAGGAGIANWHTVWSEQGSWGWIAAATTGIATLLGSVMLIKRQHQRRRRIAFSVDEPKAIEISEGVYKSGLLKDDEREVVEVMYPEATTLYESFLRGMKVSNDGPCLGTRSGPDGAYQYQHYSEIYELFHKLGSAFTLKLGLKQGPNTHVGIYARNCPEWFITMMACIRNSIVVVPLYDTLGPDAVSFIVQHTEAELVVVDEEKKLDRLLAIGGDSSYALRHIVMIGEAVVGEFTEEQQRRAAASNIHLHKYKELMAGMGELQKDLPPTPDDVYTICYTSGTTGTPKGVMLTHRNIVANTSAFVFMLEKRLPEMITQPGQVTLSYLPLSHMFEQNNHWLMIVLGGAVGYYGGDVNKLADDIHALRPTLFPVVPRLLNRFYDGIKGQVEARGVLTRTAFKLAYARKRVKLRSGIVTNDSLWDRLAFKKVQEKLGGRAKLIVTGSAPINPQVLEFCRIAFGAYIVEGYGQTENTAMATVTWPGDCDDGVGGPAVCSLLKLADCPDLGYLAKDGVGEILIKGPTVTAGYYRDPQRTKEALDSDGWLHSGDIGQLQPNKAIKIIDRKKDILKLAQGEYVSPEKVENCYCQSLLVQQCFVEGSSLERHLVSIVIPSDVQLLKLYKEVHGREATSLDEACADDQMTALVLKDMQSVGRANRLNGIEQVKAVKLDKEPWTAENGLLTPTLKAKRPQLRAKYAEAVRELYSGLAGGNLKETILHCI